MDFIEHDLKTLLATMPTPFLASEVKTLVLQLLSAIALCHDNWIVHRDLKTSNLLMNNRGQIKVADFGLARTYGDPLGDMTQLVVTLWYRFVHHLVSHSVTDLCRQIPGTLAGGDRVHHSCGHVVHRVYLWRAYPQGAFATRQG
jgi:hypothetical protein